MKYEKYVDAVMFAMKKHEGQTRDGGMPYIVHPLRVAESLREIAGVQDADILSAAVLHDTIEDTKTSFDDIAKQFGENVAIWVAELTVDKRLPKDKRKAEMMRSAGQKSKEYRLIKLADRYDNLSDLKGWGEARKQEYLKSTQDLLEAHKGTQETLERLISEKLTELRQQDSWKGDLQ